MLYICVVVVVAVVVIGRLYLHFQWKSACCCNWCVLFKIIRFSYWPLKVFNLALLTFFFQRFSICLWCINWMSLHHFFSPIHLISINFFHRYRIRYEAQDQPTDRPMISESIFSGYNIGQQIHERTKCKSVSNVGKLKKAIQFKYLTYIFRHFFWLCSHSTVFLGSLWIQVAIIIIIDEHWASFVLSFNHTFIHSFVEIEKRPLLNSVLSSFQVLCTTLYPYFIRFLFGNLWCY